MGNKREVHTSVHSGKQQFLMRMIWYSFSSRKSITSVAYVGATFVPIAFPLN